MERGTVSSSLTCDEYGAPRLQGSMQNVDWKYFEDEKKKVLDLPCKFNSLSGYDNVYESIGTQPKKQSD